MSDPSRIAALAARISANTTKVDEYLAANSLPPLSFDADAPPQFPGQNKDPDIETARQSVITDTLELNQLMRGPREHLFSYHPAHLLSQLAIVRFDLARLVPLDDGGGGGGGEATFASLAAATGLGEAHLRRLLRHAISQRVFREPRPGVVSHTAASRLLAEDRDVADWVRWAADECWPAAYHACEAMARWPGSEEPNQTGFALANRTDLGLFEYLATQPERAARFAAGMRLYAARPDLDVRHLVAGWNWGDLPAGATVVDVGGSHGAAAIALARAYPSLGLEVVVQDIDAQTIEAADARKPADVGARVRYMVHDFFAEQPVRGADVYLYRACFHNWSDRYALRMLGALVPALKPGARVVLNDVVVPGPGEVSPHEEARLRAGDLDMAVLFNAGDRELADWAHLFERAGPGFRFEGGKRPEGSGLWVLSAVWVGV
ncbi:S-adenosyl-L-methionine-dependent methyltransferase [Xylariomycetidae sp. FL2044]|nr:S-adenosyl-L-methionine-dependent methyltransferase [Xylariomycetidae sp. FL2044]